MHPYNYPHYYSRCRMFAGPSRLVWFAIGAGAATWFHYSKHGHSFGRHCVPAVRDSNQNVYTLPPPPLDGQDRSSRPPIPDSIPRYPYSPPNYSDQSRWSFSNLPDRNWEERKAKLNEISKQAQETVRTGPCNP